MGVTYKPLWKLLIDKDLKKMALMEKAGFSRATLAKMSKDEYVALKVLEDIAVALDCQIGDIVEVVRGAADPEA